MGHEWRDFDAPNRKIRIQTILEIIIMLVFASMCYGNVVRYQ